MKILSTHNNLTINKTTRTRSRSKPFASRAISAMRCAFLLSVAAIAATSGTTGSSSSLLSVMFAAAAAAAPAAAVTSASSSSTSTSTSTCSDPNTTFEKMKKKKKKVIDMCEWAADAAAAGNERKHRKRCNRKKKKTITATATATATSTVVVKVKEECPCACAQFNDNADTDIDADADISVCPAAKDFNGDMAYILSNQPCNNNDKNAPMIVCNYAYIKTGCTIETQACQPVETCFCNEDGDNSKWLCIITDYEFISSESCLSDDAPRPTLRLTGYSDRALAASKPSGDIPKDVGLDCSPNAAAELELQTQKKT